MSPRWDSGNIASKTQDLLRSALGYDMPPLCD